MKAASWHHLHRHSQPVWTGCWSLPDIWLVLGQFELSSRVALQQQQQQGSDIGKVANEFNSSPATFNMPMKVKRQWHSSLETSKTSWPGAETKTGIPVLTLSLRARCQTADWKMPRMLDCCSIGDHVPLIGYWWAEPGGTMSKMSSHTIGTRHLWLFSPEKKWKVLVLPLAHQERCCSGQTRLTFLDHVWKAEEKVSSRPARLSHFGWFKGPVITFLSHRSLLGSQPYDAFNDARCLHQTGTSKIRSLEKLLAITMVTAMGQI